jgi:hypothetical protein
MRLSVPFTYCYYCLYYHDTEANQNYRRLYIDIQTNFALGFAYFFTEERRRQRGDAYVFTEKAGTLVPKVMHPPPSKRLRRGGQPKRCVVAKKLKTQKSW